MAVDAQGRVYVADAWNNRVQVFDSSGAYLTTIGGAWGGGSGQFRGAIAVDVDSAGNVYVADVTNHRIQKFAPGVPGWEQVNINGFGNLRNDSVSSLAFFSDTLYAGTINFDTGGEIWRMGNPWTAVITGGLGYAYNVGIDHLIEFKGDLYAGTWADTVNGGEVWRYDGLGWTRVVSGGFGDTGNAEALHFAVFGDTLYASTFNWTGGGGEIWYSSNGNVGSWNNANVPWDTDNWCASALEVFNGYLYASTWNPTDGGEIWRTPDGTTWIQVNTNGFGNSDNLGVPWLAVFDGHLYAGMANTTTAGQVWRCSTCDGSDWSQVVSDGFGSMDNFGTAPLIVSDDYLYCAAGSGETETTGFEVWRSSTGDPGDWEQVGSDGFGDSNNWGTHWGNSVAAGSLYIGTRNWANGGEVWQLAAGGQVYLPIILKNYP